MLLTTDAVGGVWRYSLDLAAGMVQRPILVVLGPSPSPLQRDEAAALGLRLIDTGLPLDWTAADPAALTAVTAALKDLAAGQGVRSVHLHAPALAGPDRWEPATVVVAHSCVATWWQAVRGGGPLPDDLAWRAEATRIGLHTADAVIAPSDAHAEATRRAYGDCVMTTVHNGAPPPLAGEARGEGDSTGPILTAGRLWDEAKNATGLDQIASRLDTPIHAAGPVAGPNGAQIHLPNLHLLGSLDARAMRRAYAKASVFASLARYEPFGLSVLEAAQSGLRLVLSDIPTFRELWDGAARFVSLDADPVPALRAALADTGDATRHAARYTLEKTVAGTLAVHRRLGAYA